MFGYCYWKAWMACIPTGDSGDSKVYWFRWGPVMSIGHSLVTERASVHRKSYFRIPFSYLMRMLMEFTLCSNSICWQLWLKTRVVRLHLHHLGTVQRQLSTLFHVLYDLRSHRNFSVNWQCISVICPIEWYALLSSICIINNLTMTKLTATVCNFNV